MKKTLFIGGEERPVNFGTLFLYNFQERFNANPLTNLNKLLAFIPKNAADDMEVGTAMFASLDFSYMFNVLWLGLEAGAELSGSGEQFDKVELAEMVDDAGGMEFLIEVMTMMFTWMPVNNKKNGVAKAAANAPAKKKRTN